MNLGTKIKDPHASIGIAINWTDYLGSNIITGTPTWSAANGLTFVGSPSFAANVTSHVVAGGQEGCDYLVTCQVTLDSGVIEEGTVLVKVRTGAEDPRLAR